MTMQDLPGGWHLERRPLDAAAQPGQWLETAGGRKLPILRAGPGWSEVLYAGEPAPAGVRLAGEPFALAPPPRALLLGDESGWPLLVHLAARLRQGPERVKILVLLGTGREPPFKPQPSRIIVPELPAWVIATLPLLEDWNVPARLCAAEERPGCFEGSPLALAAVWLDALQGAADVAVYAAGSATFVNDAARLAAAQRLVFHGRTL